jgi:hypothetical protein
VLICAGYYLYVNWTRHVTPATTQQSETTPPPTPTPLEVTPTPTHIHRKRATTQRHEARLAPMPPVSPAPIEQTLVQTPLIQPAAAMPRAYSGPSSGWLIWTGKLTKNQILTIDGSTTSTGSLEGELPGVPVNLIVDVTNIGLDEEPSSRNGWKRLALRSLGKHFVIRIHWTVK